MSKEGIDNSSGVSSVILGILSITSIFLVFFAVFAPLTGLILGVLALFFAMAQKKSHKNKWAKHGMILAIIGIILNILLIFGMVSAVKDVLTQYSILCDAAGGCENIPQYLQSQSP